MYKDINIEKLYEEQKRVNELNKQIEVEKLDKERMENSNNKFAQDNVPFQEEKIDNLTAERNKIMEENKELDTLGVNKTR